MEKLELRKKLEKKKAYIVCLMIFLTLSIPTFMGLCREFNLSRSIQISVLAGILMIITILYKRMNRVRTRIKSL